VNLAQIMVGINLACNAKRFKESFKNWTSENKDIDEFIQHSG